MNVSMGPLFGVFFSFCCCFFRRQFSENVWSPPKSTIQNRLSFFTHGSLSLTLSTIFFSFVFSLFDRRSFLLLIRWAMQFPLNYSKKITHFSVLLSHDTYSYACSIATVVVVVVSNFLLFFLWLFTRFILLENSNECKQFIKNLLPISTSRLMFEGMLVFALIKKISIRNG